MSRFYQSLCPCILSRCMRTNFCLFDTVLIAKLLFIIGRIQNKLHCILGWHITWLLWMVNWLYVIYIFCFNILLLRRKYRICDVSIEVSRRIKEDICFLLERDFTTSCNYKYSRILWYISCTVAVNKWEWFIDNFRLRQYCLKPLILSVGTLKCITYEFSA